jgi:hypothetical protein
MEGEAGDTVMDATTGAVRVSVSGELVTPLAAAVICVVPTATPVAKPLLLIVAIVVALLAQVKATPLMVLPLLSFAVAVNCCVVFIAMDGEAGVTVMDATVELLELEFEVPPPQLTRDTHATTNKDNGAARRGDDPNRE